MVAENRFSAVSARPAAAESAPPLPPSRGKKYTITLSDEVRQRLDVDVDRLAAQTGLRVDRRHVTIALYQALADDESLFAEVKRRMPRLVEQLSRRDG